MQAGPFRPTGLHAAVPERVARMPRETLRGPAQRRIFRTRVDRAARRPRVAVATRGPAARAPQSFVAPTRGGWRTSGSAGIRGLITTAAGVSARRLAVAD